MEIVYSVPNNKTYPIAIAPYKTGVVSFRVVVPGNCKVKEVSKYMASRL